MADAKHIAGLMHRQNEYTYKIQEEEFVSS